MLFSRDRIRLWLVFGCCLFSLLMDVKISLAAITVQTTDGRELTGEVDQQTDEQLLWIRQQRERILLTTSIAWNKVHAVSHEGQILPPEQLPTLLLEQATSEPVGFLLQQVVYNVPAACHGDCAIAPSRHSRSRSTSAKVRSLSVEALLVNLDRDVEPDGLELLVAALDEHGVPVPVRGNLYVQLWGERIQPHGSLVDYEALQQWSQAVQPADFVDGVASYALRFRNVRPEFDFGLHSEAIVNVRLGAAGQGNFSASAPVVIRSFQPFRDRLQLYTGGRFLPDELTNEVRHTLPRRTHGRRLNFN